MNLRLKEIWQNQTTESDEHETLTIVEPIVDEFEQWVNEQQLACYIAFDEFDIW